MKKLMLFLAFVSVLLSGCLSSGSYESKSTSVKLSEKNGSTVQGNIK